MIDAASVGAVLLGAGRLVRLGLATRKVARARTDEARTAAKRSLEELLANAKGIGAKAGQIAGTLAADGSFDRLYDGLEPLPLPLIETALAAAWGTRCGAVLSELSPRGIGASLGQVHRARLGDGSDVAVKVRYPGIERAVAAELLAASWLPSAGPVRAWGFDLDAYHRLIRQNMARELDYRSEAARQSRFAAAVQCPGLVVPKVHERYTRENVLVTSWEDGARLETAAAYGLRDRLLLAQTVLSTFFASVFVAGEVHADPHPGNVRVRRVPAKRPQLVLLDFGCTLTLARERRLALLRLLLALREGEGASVGPCLSLLGFDGRKLVRAGLPFIDLLKVLLEPWLVDRPFDPRAWDVRRRSDALMGELRWWFRSAAPPDVLLFVRALGGVVRQLEALEAPIPWWPVLAGAIGPVILDEARALALSPPSSADPVPALARSLRVRIVETCTAGPGSGDKELMTVTMPAAEALDLERLVPDEVKRRLEREGQAIGGIVRRLAESRLAPQHVFAATEGTRRYLVWLE